METYLLIPVIALVIIFFGVIIPAMRRYKRCPSDKLLVIYGKTGKDQSSGMARSARCIHGGAAFVWPLLQNYEYLDLKPITIEINLRSALSKQNIRIHVPSIFTVAISAEEGVMLNAAIRLLGLRKDQIEETAENIIIGQLRAVIATMAIEEIIVNREKFLENVRVSVGNELVKIGLNLINVNIKDIIDESGYIEALGKEAASRAINEAKKLVAERDRDGEIGRARAEQDQRIQVADADSQAVKGENTAKITIANSDSDRREREAEAEKRAIAAERIQAAKAKEESYIAEEAAEKQRAERDRASQKADTIVPAQIAKERIEIEAEAAAQKLRREAKGKGDATFNEMEGEARGINEILTKRAAGLKKIVEAAGMEPSAAAMLMVTEKLPEIARIQVDAIKGIKIDKVIVWDNLGGGNDKDGKTPKTAQFMSGMLGALPMWNDLFKSVGFNLADFFEKSKEEKQEDEVIASVEEVEPESYEDEMKQDEDN
ncbi:MAG: SPFH domain-containing protein [Candidatus Hatepunaea meridiana]|nr:SPFH domain-containing protein [Candidatus Hatepunaea meridiana]